MNTEYAFTAKIYDPLLYHALHGIRQEIIRLIPSHDARILDLCCGTGDQLKRLSKAGFRNLTGVDRSEAMLNIAKKGNKIKRLLKRDSQFTGLCHASFDIIIISFAVHEKKPGVQEKMLAEANRLLASHGRIIFADFSLDDQANRVGKLGATMIERMAGTEHYRNFKAYVSNGGMEALIKDIFEVKQQIRHALGAVCIWVAAKRSL